jgi:DNA-binding transcriptional MerR regulator
MLLKKTYYSISEVSKMLNIKEHTIRFWDSKLPDLSKRDNKGKTRFFNLKQIEKLSKINDILKKNDSITLAYEILSKNNYKKSSINTNNNDNLKADSIKFHENIDKIKNISRNLKNLLN